MNDRAFFWGNASWRSEQQWRPNELLHWYALRYWKARGVNTLFGTGLYSPASTMPFPFLSPSHV